MRQDPARTVIEAGPPEATRRVLGQLTGRGPGPTLICVGGIHGNKPAGVVALRRVIDTLQSASSEFRGEFVGLAGNLEALALRRRYITKDLNRQWLPRHDVAATAQSHEDGSEDRERGDFLAELEKIFARARGEVFILDIHTTSSVGAPFVVMGDTLANRKFALHFPVPIVLGLEEHLDGTLAEYLTNRGHVTITFEAGQHESPAAVDQAEAAVWLALAAAGNLDGAKSRRGREARKLLARCTSGTPRVLEVRYRHPVFEGDEFRMEPGFANFQPIGPGQLLARDRRGEIRSRWDGRVLMPLYQDLGDDGFFVVREFKRTWLKISALLRGFRLDAIVHWFPGISRHPTRPNTFVVDRRVARWHALELMHLLGFRKRRALGDVLLVSRRRQDTSRRR